MTFIEIDKILTDNGWVKKATRGSHVHYEHPKKPGKVTVPKHGGDIPNGTLNAIYKQAGLK